MLQAQNACLQDKAIPDIYQRSHKERSRITIRRNVKVSVQLLFIDYLRIAAPPYFTDYFLVYHIRKDITSGFAKFMHYF